MLGQAAVVAAYAARIKFADGYPDPPEATADLGLACAQLVLMACLAPALVTTLGRSARTATTGMAWTVLAALLAGRTAGQTLSLAAVVTVWSAAIAVWSRFPPAALGLLFLTAGGPVLFYVSHEYAVAPLALGSTATLFSPTLGACTTRFHNDWLWPLLPPIGLIALAIFAFSRRKSPSLRAPIR